MIVKTHDGYFYRVVETGNPDFAHFWRGVELTRTSRGWKVKYESWPGRDQLISKEGSLLME